MISTMILEAILDSLKDPLLYADAKHVIRYMNTAAKTYYKEGEKLIGTSLLDCHDEQSCKVIIDLLEAMNTGVDERLITDNEKHRIYMRAVRDADGNVLGNFERYEPPRTLRESHST